MWDQRINRHLRHLRRRIIPTYVGSTYPVPGIASKYTNHSHVCGINQYLAIRVGGTFESFPRMWDQLGKLLLAFRFERIIPTYVGSTLQTIPLSGGGTNHSHVCGINDEMDELDEGMIESFPRMWDQRNTGMISRICFRIIPTYVGSTINHFQCHAVPPNHSHVCGINSRYWMVPIR